MKFSIVLAVLCGLGTASPTGGQTLQHQQVSYSCRSMHPA